MHFAHGHDSKDPLAQNIYNLDNQLGKSSRWGPNNRDIYTVLYSREGSISPVMRPTETEKTDSLRHNPDYPKLQDLSSQSSSTNPTVITSLESHRHFFSQLNKIKIKEKELRANHHTVAADDAKDLYTIVIENYIDLINNTIDTKNFKHNCVKAINNARPELETHRGWKQVLGNLALAVIGLGVLYGVAVLINKATTGKFLFFKTDSANKIDQLEREIESMFLNSAVESSRESLMC